MAGSIVHVQFAKGTPSYGGLYTNAGNPRCQRRVTYRATVRQSWQATGDIEKMTALEAIPGPLDGIPSQPVLGLVARWQPFIYYICGSNRG